MVDAKDAKDAKDARDAKAAEAKGAMATERRPRQSRQSRRSQIQKSRCRAWLQRLGVLLCGAAALYTFLCGLSVLGSGARLLGGRAAGSLFSGIADPVAALMVGALATVLVQSSSTSTSIVVTLVGASIMSVRTAIPVIMGANIGTSVTNTIVSVGHARRSSSEYAKAFAAATIHDLFNLLNVAVLLPVEAVSAWAQGAGGPLYWASVELTDSMEGADASDAAFVSPVKAITGPLSSAILSVDKDRLRALSFGRPTLETCSDTVAAGIDLAVCGNTTKLEAATRSWDAVRDGTLSDGGVLHGANISDEAAGTVAVLGGLLLTVIALIAIVRTLVYIMKSRADRGIMDAGRSGHASLGIAVGAAITLLVQSSSITTSALTPMVATGALTLEQAFPLTLGANIGTCGTALIASMVSGTRAALQIALVHLLFNVIGIVLWYPAHAHLLTTARGLGAIAGEHRWFPAAYAVGVFVAAPLTLFGLSVAVGGLAVAIIVAAAAVTAAAWRCFRRGSRESMRQDDTT